MSWADYERLGEDVRSEYIDGRLMMTPAPSRAHQICQRLVPVLQGAVHQAEVTLGWGWKPRADEFVPDLMVHPVTDENIRFTGMPLLVVEVLSGNRADDLVGKATKYDALGLSDYWVVDPRAHSLTTFHLDGAAYESTGLYDAGVDELTFAHYSVHVDVDVDALLA
jgi:Uma2 family endonuclease